MLPAIGIVLIIIGLLIKYISKKIMKSDLSLHYGTIKECKKEAGSYLLSVEYSPDNSANTETITLETKKAPGKDHIVIKIDDETLDAEIYTGYIKMLLISSAFLVVGISMCAFLK